MFSRGEDPLKDIAVDVSSDREDSPNSQASPSLLSPVVALPSYELPTIPLPIGTKSSQPKSLIYLLDCYSRIATEERNHPKVCICLESENRFYFKPQFAMLTLGRLFFFSDQAYLLFPKCWQF